MNKIFRINFPHDTNSLDPRKNYDVIGSTMHFMLFEGLTKMTPKSTREYALAEKIDISEDKKTYTFHLRNALWSNKEEVTAYDFVYAWKSILDPNFPAPNAHLLFPIKNAEKAKKGELSIDLIGVIAKDAKTLQVDLESPTPYFLDLTSFCVFFPVPHKIAQNNPKWADSLNPDLVTNGPFKLASWEIANHLIFHKNPLFWEKEKVFLDQIFVHILNDENTALNMYQNQELDFYGGLLTSIPSDWLEKLRSTNMFHTTPVGASTFITFNLENRFFKNVSIRKAFALAIDKKDLVDNITMNEEEIATGCIPSLLKHSGQLDLTKNETLSPKQHLEKGLRELNATKSDLEKITYRYFSNIIHKKIAQFLQLQWLKNLDLKINLEELDFKIFMDYLNRKDYAFAQCMYFVQYNDPMNILDRFKYRTNAKNYPGWENQNYIKLLNESLSLETEEKRFCCLEEAEKILVEEIPFACLYHWNVGYLLQSYIRGFFISPVGSMHFNNVEIVDGAH